MFSERIGKISAVAIAMWTALCATTFCVAREPATTPSGDPIAALIRQLGDVDPSVRESAAAALKVKGNEARAALLAASRTDDPQIAPAASEILLAMPWWTPGDPPMLRAMLEGYGAKPPEQRVAILEALAASPNIDTTSLLLRVARGEPSDEVGWRVTNLLRRHGSAALWARLREIDLADAPPPLVAIVGRACLSSDSRKAAALLRRAVDASTPEDLGGVAEWLDAAAIVSADAAYEKRWADAIAVQRKIVERLLSLGQENESVKRAAQLHLLQLFMFHALGGPELGYAEDAARWHDAAGGVEFYVAAAWFDRAGMRPIADVIAAAGVGASRDTTTSLALATALDWLERDEWIDGILRDVNARLSDRPIDAARAVGTYRLAARLSEAGHYDQAAAVLDDLVRVRKVMGANDELEGLPDLLELSATAKWNRLLLADAAGDRAEADRLATELLPPTPVTEWESDLPIDLVNYLKAHGRVDDAERIIADRSAALRAKVSVNPRSAKPLNGVAWFLSRSGAHLGEAVDASTRAIEMEPDNYAMLDTAADAAFMNGDAKRAVMLETRALRLRPCDPFIKKQLARFAAGK